MHDRTISEGDLTSAQTRAELNCGETKFWSLLNKKELEAYYVGKQIRVTRQSVDDYRARHRYTPRAELKGSKGSETFARMTGKAVA